MAPVNGSERYLTLGCGHTAAICKFALNGGGPTSEKSLQDEHGMLCVQKPEGNPTFKSMIQDGWAWDIIPCDVDIQYPWFAMVAEKALHTSNHVATEVGELEGLKVSSISRKGPWQMAWTASTEQMLAWSW